jgi:fatty-acid desaturase
MKYLANLRLRLLLIQVYIHCMFLLGLLYITPLLTIPTIILCQILFVGLCGTVFYHRVVTHKNSIKPIFEKLLLILSWIGASGSAIGWAATHRCHHRWVDTIRDPHSPTHMGKFKVYWWSSGDSTSIKYVPDLLRKPFYVFQHKHYFLVLLVYHVLLISILPIEYYWAAAIAPAFSMWFAGSITNVYGHDSRGPVNNTLLGLLFGGEGWHKNHHDDPASPIFNSRGDWGSLLYKLVKS